MPRVALVQFAPLSPSSSDLPTSASQKNTDDDPATLSSQYNLQRAHDYVRQAAKQGAELIVRPPFPLS